MYKICRLKMYKISILYIIFISLLLHLTFMFTFTLFLYVDLHTSHVFKLRAFETFSYDEKEKLRNKELR